MSDHRYRTKRWRQLRAQVIRTHGRICAIPGCQNDMTRPNWTHVDHIVEAKDGGDFWDPHNLQVLCKPHHTAKTIHARATRGAPLSPNA